MASRFECGDILLVNYPHTDQAGSKLRPVLVVSSDVFNRGDDVVVVPISSVPDRDNPFAVFLDDRDENFSRTGLKRSSSVKWIKPYTVSRIVVQRRLGRLTDERLAEVRAGLRQLFS